MRHTVRDACAGALLGFLFTGATPVGALGQDDEDVPLPLAERPVVRANVLPANFEMDGGSGAAWKGARDSIPALVMVEPDEGEAAGAPTIVKVFASPDEILIAAWCRDPEPERIVSFSKARDSDLSEEDHLVVALDTFLDSRTGYVFKVNPTGARFDGLVPRSGDEVNADWDAIWEAKTSRDATGWYAAIKIPVKSLSYGKSLDRWGFNVERRVARLQEVDRWSGASLDYSVSQMSQAGLLAGLPKFDYDLGTSVRPAFTSRTQKPGPGMDFDTDADISLDITQKITSNLLGALTVNTDFAETEVDARQTNLTRFPIYFPEKRTFFLEGSDIFEFGAGLDEESLIPFFSRRIGLFGPDEEEQTAVPINVGGKVNGRLGNTNIGALVVETRRVDSLEVDAPGRITVPGATMGAVRVSQNVFEESSVGMLATFGDPQDRTGAWSTGADFTYETSSFRGEKNFLAGVWGLLNDRTGLNGDKSAWGARIDYPNDLWDVNATSIRIGDGFDPSLGFMVRNNVHIWDFGCEFNPRPQLPWLRQMYHEFSFTIFNELDNSAWQSYNVTVKPLDWLLESGDRFDAAVVPEGDRPPTDFEVAADVDMPKGSFEWVRYEMGVRSAERRRLSGELRWETGSYYNGDLNTILARLTCKPSALLALELTGEWNTGTVQALIDDWEELQRYETIEKTFNENLFGFRLQLNVSPNLQFSSFTQYDTESRELGSNNRLRWTFHPQGDLFLVYNHNEHRELDNRWSYLSGELPVKVQYTVRF